MISRLSILIVVLTIFTFTINPVYSYTPTSLFVNNLSVGTTSEDVKQLQIILNKDPDTRVSLVGSGSPGNETAYFGFATKDAVVKFQEKYAEQVLYPFGLQQGTGYFGPITRLWFNVLILQERLASLKSEAILSGGCLEDSCDNTVSSVTSASVKQTTDNTSKNYNDSTLGSDLASPSVPLNLLVNEVTSNSIRLSWSASVDPDFKQKITSGISHYIINYGDLSLNSNITSVYITDLIPNTSYLLSVKAVDVAGNQSKPSEKITAKTEVKPTINVLPTISGTPATTTLVNDVYTFTPVASDENNDPLTFTITNKPAWATFNTKTGALSGTPTTVGTTTGIKISVTDGKSGYLSLPLFNIVVGKVITVVDTTPLIPSSTLMTGSVIDAIKADMTMLNEAPLLGISTTTATGWKKGSVMSMGGTPRGDNSPYYWSPANLTYKSADYWNAIVPWYTLHKGIDYKATNVRVKIYNITAYILKKSTNTWELVGAKDSNPTWAKYQKFDFGSAIELGNASARVEPDGKLSYKLTAESSRIHGGSDRFPITGSDVRAVFIHMTTELILDDPKGVDDRHLAQLLFSAAADYYPNMTTKVADYSPMTYAPNVAGSRHGLVSATPRIHYVATINPPGQAKDVSEYQKAGGISSISVAEFESNLPPNLTSGTVGLNSNFTLSWSSASSTVTDYQVKIDNGVPISKGTALSMTTTPASLKFVAGSTHTFSVRACNGALCSAWSTGKVLTVSSIITPPPPITKKSNPGHYVTIGGGTVSKLDDSPTITSDGLVFATELKNSGVKGVVVRYNWKEMEPTKDNYNFTRIKKHLDLLQSVGLKMVIFVDDKAFSGPTPLPDYLMANTDYYFLNTEGSYSATRWNPYVLSRFKALFNKLGTELDGHLALEGVTYPETSTQLGSTTVPPYDPVLYKDVIIETLTSQAKAFPKSNVFWMMNYIPSGYHNGVFMKNSESQALVRDIANATMPLGVIMGGPDILPEDASLVKRAYPFYDEFSAKGMKLFGSAQNESHRHLHSTTTGSAVYSTRFWTPLEIFQYGRDKLHISYLFWNYKTWLTKITDLKYYGPGEYVWADDIPVIKANAVFNPVTPKKFNINQNIKTTASVNVRSTSTTDVLGTQASGVAGTIILDPITVISSLIPNSKWWRIDFGTGIDGWVNEDYLTAL